MFSFLTPWKPCTNIWLLSIVCKLNDFRIENCWLYAEIAAIRYLMGNGFGLLAGGNLSVEKWNEKVKEADSNLDSIVRSLLEKRRAMPHMK
jgi:hypothetical protein